MKSIIEMPGVSLPTPSNLPPVSRSPEGIAMAHIPGWSLFADPKYVKNGRVRNRAAPRSLTSTSGTLAFTTLNGEQMIDTTAAEARLTGLPAIDPTSWTVFSVFRPIELTGPSYDVARSITDAPVGGLSMRVGLNAGAARITIYEGTSAIRLAYTPPINFNNRLALLMYTFSVRDGLKIFENGELVATAPDDKRPLTQGYGAGQWQMYRLNRGLIGMGGHLHTDLGAPENDGYRRQIEQFLMEKYGIAA